PGIHRQPCLFLPRHAQDFLERGDAFEHLAPTIFADARPQTAGVASQLLLGGGAMDQAAHDGVEDHQFVETRAPAVPLLVTLGTTLGVIEKRPGFRTNTQQRALCFSSRPALTAMRAYHSDQTLSQDTQ